MLLPRDGRLDYLGRLGNLRMNSESRVWVNLAISVGMGVASLLITHIQGGSGLPDTAEDWTVLVMMIVLNVGGNLRAWMTNTPEQARVVEENKGRLNDLDKQVPPK